MSAGSLASRETLTGDLAEFLNEVKIEHALTARGRLIFGLDATASRKPTWDMAAGFQSQMFKEAAAVGNLDMQLVFFRGDAECKATSWLSDPARLAQIMSKIDVRAGVTQIEKILTHVEKETTLLHVGALVFIGDACEENPDTLIVKARDVGRAKTPAFMFQEGTDPDVQRAFQDIARDTGGAYAKFGPGAAKELGELLKAVVRYAVGGIAALGKDEASVLLLGQLRKGD
jgi:hypothetical protein